MSSKKREGLISWDRVLVFGSLAIVIALYVLEIYLQNANIELGIVLGKEEDQLKVAKKENLLLKQELLQLESYTTIYQEAKTQGFTGEYDNILYIK